MICWDDEARRREKLRESEHIRGQKRKTIRVSPASWRDSPNGVMAHPKPLYRCDDMSSVEGGQTSPLGILGLPAIHCGEEVKRVSKEMGA